MTQKELLYLEDAVMHECSIVSILGETIQNVDDKKIIDFLDKEIEKHNKIKNKLMKLLEDNCNE